MYQCISFLGTNITLAWPTQQQIDCSSTGRIRHSLLHTRLNQMFCNKTLKLCTVYNKYTQKKPWELRLSCRIAGPDLPYVLAAKAGLRTENVALLFFSVSDLVFRRWKLKISWEKNKVVWTEIRLYTGYTVCWHCVSRVNPFVRPVNGWLSLNNLDFILELSYRPAVPPHPSLWQPLEVLPRAGAPLCVRVWMFVCLLTDFYGLKN